MNDFHFSRMVGVPASIVVLQSEVDGKIYANINAIKKLASGVEVKATRKIFFDLDDPATYQEAQELPEWVLKKINQSEEARAKKLVFAKDKNVTAATADSSSEDDVPF
jgi:hypothetical protein